MQIFYNKFKRLYLKKKILFDQEDEIYSYPSLIITEIIPSQRYIYLSV